MDPAFLDLLRCPIDPDRTAKLTPQPGHLACDRCAVRYPVRQGLPVLIAEEGQLPDGVADLDRLPCRRG